MPEVEFTVDEAGVRWDDDRERIIGPQLGKGIPLVGPRPSLGEPSPGLWVSAKMARTTVAFAWCTPNDEGTFDSFVVVAADETRTGLGTSVMRWLIEAARELAMVPIEGTVSADNEHRAAAAAVLRKAGFECDPPFSEALVRMFGCYTTYVR